ncbi:MAG: WYL domain-containing protein, partial [Cryomorphaceae bacterium]
MPANKYALLRYRIIDRCISNRFKPYPDKAALRRACEEELYGSEGDYISESTIDKDLYAMRNEINLGYHAPIAY